MKDNRELIMVSLNEVDSFDAKPKNYTDEQFIEEIKAYNGSALFSSNNLRSAGQSERHIHFLLKQVEKLNKKLIEANKEIDKLNDEVFFANYFPNNGDQCE